jgi:hypothetical protein
VVATNAKLSRRESGASNTSVDGNEIEHVMVGGGEDSCRCCGAHTLPVAKAKQEVSMAKIDLDSLNIEELALLRDRTIEKTRALT